MDFKFKHGFKAKAEKTAIKLRNDLGLKPYEKLCGFKLANHLLVKVTDPLSLGLPEEEAYNLMDQSSGWSALTINFYGDKKLIIHNILHSNKRQQSNLMHEIAHILCEHDFPQHNFTKSTFNLRHYSKELEAEAEWLGGTLQLPRQALYYWLKRKNSLENIAKYFEASEQMVRFRFNTTGLKKQYPNFL